ncbi:hypothetical protein H5410_043367 [Solanum commersonii]|uniref:NB-ARC domain-containing protein n=1 Tax=Solanum commersonii TaxID=4109 RepID=A0A9J5XY90_SOLCO|nr:hypothetical protein H5410_043367 [Solanum commersonii]
MGGIGKTTLARKVYHHLTIRYHFDILSWVTISQEFRVRNVLLEALHCISKQTVSVRKDYNYMDDSELADLVQKGRRYLVVVDDIWSTDVWDRIRGIFPNYNNGSRILLTTRETEVAIGYPNFDITLPRKIWMMKNLRYIRLGGATYLPSPRTESLVTGMPNLEELSGICFTSCTNEVFTSIPNLKRLIIHLPFFSFKHFPHSLTDMSSLRKLEAFKFYCWLDSSCMSISIKSLSRCKHFLWENISSTLKMLPNLEELRLNDCRADDDVWRLSDEDNFTSLKLLVLSTLNLEHWEASSDNFPNLKRLVLKNCDQLQEIPTDFGEICTFTAAEDSAREIEQEQEDMGNDFLKGIEAYFEVPFNAVFQMQNLLVYILKSKIIIPKIPSHASLMTHNQKIELDSIRKERNRLKKILKEIGGIEIHKPNIGSNLNDMTFFENSNLEEKVSNLELEHHIECSNLKNLDDNKLKWELKGFQLIS